MDPWTYRPNHRPTRLCRQRWLDFLQSRLQDELALAFEDIVSQLETMLGSLQPHRQSTIAGALMTSPYYMCGSRMLHLYRMDKEYQEFEQRSATTSLVSEMYVFFLNEHLPDCFLWKSHWSVPVSAIHR